MEPDVHKLQELVEWAEAEEAKTEGGNWNQGVWLNIPAARHGKYRVPEEQLCDSSYCIAGKAVIDAGFRTFYTSDLGSAVMTLTEKGECGIEDLAYELLGIEPYRLYKHPTNDVARHGATLFEPDIDAAEIRVTAEAIAGKEL